MLRNIITSYGPNAVRHLAQLAAGALITNGYLDTGAEEIFLGVVVGATTLLWSAAEKKGLLKAVGL